LGDILAQLWDGQLAASIKLAWLNDVLVVNRHAPQGESAAKEHHDQAGGHDRAKRHRHEKSVGPGQGRDVVYED